MHKSILIGLFLPVVLAGCLASCGTAAVEGSVPTGHCRVIFSYWYVLDGSKRCFDTQDTFAAPGSAEEDIPSVAVPLLVAAP